jgi:hypothetical protein
MLHQKLVVLTVAAFALASSIQAQEPGPCDSAPYVVFLGERTADLSAKGVNKASLLTVLPDGRFHLERRVQAAPGEAVVLTIFESTLTSEQLQRLRGILDSDNIKRLPAYERPKFGNVAMFQIFEAKIFRDPIIQHVGYGDWVEEGSDAAPNSAESKKAWGEARVKLSPLLEWMHALETSDQLKPVSDGASRLCSPHA